MDFAALFQHDVDPRIAEAARYLASIAPDTALPNRQDFRPSKVRSILGNMFLVDLIPGDYHYSLFGVTMAVLFGSDLTGRKLSDLGAPAIQESLGRTYDAVAESGTFRYIRGRYVWPERAIAIERLLVPMCNSEGALTTIFGLTIPAVPTDMLVVLAGIGAATLEVDETVTG